MTQRTPSSVLVTGASGRTGHELLAVLRRTSLHVRALTRSEHNRTLLQANGADEVVVGDLLEPVGARRAVEGCDAILFAAGSSLTTGLLRPHRVIDRDGVINLVDAAADTTVHKFVFQSSIGAGNSRLGMPLWARLLVLRWAVRDKERAEQALRDSDIDHIIFRPGWLRGDPPSTEVILAEGGGAMTGSVPRVDVARLMVAALVSPEATNRTFEVVTRESMNRTDPDKFVDVEWNDRFKTVVPASHE
ncbi:3-beta hydroxysteroid dehydrogenase (plasmid) [Salinigranum rubrum]|uniref:3-beta hydroxysteroid dehydrogenase n=1 Tax=Salinigranum rubrum TaxID=755307 RepID=A0A2I8VQC7_9EURY|nr:SDR family oxidoreductase [Salinigranum rubrum]AUV84084.1 3-beta hydroxysteroid dehydrogenase [Salinigranum rubrum]